MTVTMKSQVYTLSLLLVDIKSRCLYSMASFVVFNIYSSVFLLILYPLSWVSQCQFVSPLLPSLIFHINKDAAAMLLSVLQLQLIIISTFKWDYISCHLLPSSQYLHEVLLFKSLVIPWALIIIISGLVELHRSKKIKIMLYAQVYYYHSLPTLSTPLKMSLFFQVAVLYLT